MDAAIRPLACLALSIVSLVSIGSGQERGAARQYQLRQIEVFHAAGAEPVYWATHVLSDFDRWDTSPSEAAFIFELKQFDAIMGAHEQIRFVVDQGANWMVIREDPVTKKIALAGEATIISRMNAMVDSLGAKNVSESWTERVRLPDPGLIPGATSGELEVRFSTELMAVDRLALRIIQFETDSARYEVDGTTVAMGYRGVFIVDPDLRLVYHSFFEQTGTVGARTEVTHKVLVSLRNQGDETIVPLTGPLLELINFSGVPSRPGIAPLSPQIIEGAPRPAWATSVWLAGRVACTSLSLLAERGTNPVPVLSLGGLVLTDQALGYAGNIYLDHLDVKAKRKSEEDGLAPYDHEYQSPIEQVYAKPDAGPSRFAERLALLGPKTTGAASVDDDVYGIGLPLLAASQLLQSSGPSQLESLMSDTSGGMVFSSAGLLTPAKSLAIIPLVAVVGVLAVSDGGGGGGGNITLTFQEDARGVGCASGLVRLNAVNQASGAMIRLSATGDADDLSGGTVPWSESMMGQVLPNGSLSLQIPIIVHCPCLSGTVTVEVGGRPAPFFSDGVEFNGSVSNVCF